jgi:hypothetical protein
MTSYASRLFPTSQAHLVAEDSAAEWGLEHEPQPLLADGLPLFGLAFELEIDGGL